MACILDRVMFLSMIHFDLFHVELNKPQNKNSIHEQEIGIKFFSFPVIFIRVITK
jgi:hypothetical protein